MKSRTIIFTLSASVYYSVYHCKSFNQLSWTMATKKNNGRDSKERITTGKEKDESVTLTAIGKGREKGEKRNSIVDKEAGVATHGHKH